MKPAHWLLLFTVLAALGFTALDRIYIAKFEGRFKEIEQQRIITSNKLATAKIVSENLNHVRELIFANMDIPGHADTAAPETILFDFLTAAVNDLKMKVVSVKPSRPLTVGRVTTFGYDLELEGDFFTFGELCSRLENSRRILDVRTFEVDLLNEEAAAAARSRSWTPAGTKGIRVKMRVHSYRVKKGAV